MSRTGSDAAAVVASYTPRAEFAAAESSHARVPTALADLLQSAQRVAEIPCAGGHYLAAYTTAECHVTLIDASAAMLDVARRAAVAAGLGPDRCTTVEAFVQDLPPLDIDLLVVPNAALSQIAQQAGLTKTLAALCRVCPAETRLFAQVLCTRSDGVDPCDLYDQTKAEQRWFTDRTFDPPVAGAARRLRRQHRAGNTLHLDFDYRTSNDTSLHTNTAALRLHSPAKVRAACRAAGLTDVVLTTGDRMSEITATVAGVPR